MEHVLTGIVSGICGVLATGIPLLLAYKKQKDTHDEAIAKVTAERDIALANTKVQSDDKAFARLDQLYDRLSGEVDNLKSSHKECEKKYEELEGKYEDLKKESTVDKAQIEEMRQELDNLRAKMKG